MRKIFLILIMFMFISLSGCISGFKVPNDIPNNIEDDIEMLLPILNAEEIDSDIKERIKLSYIEMFMEKANNEFSIDDIEISNYYGEFNNTYIVMIECTFPPYIESIRYELIDGVGVIYYGNRIYAWHDDVFYTLTEAYDRELISKADLINIGGKEVIKPKKEIPKEMEETIKQRYLDKFIKNPKDASIDNVNIYKYYGEYNNAYVVMMTSAYMMYTQALWGETVAGVYFQYNDGNRIYVYFKNDFYTLGEAYQKGVLIKDDLFSIVFYNK